MGPFLTWLLLAALVDNQLLSRATTSSTAPPDRRTTPATRRHVVLAAGIALLALFPASGLLHRFLLQPHDLLYLHSLSVTLVAALCSALALRVLAAFAASADDDVEPDPAIPWRVTGSVVLIGAALASRDMDQSAVQAIMDGLTSAAGFAVFVFALDALQERLTRTPVPAALGGLPIMLLTAGLIALGLSGFGPA